MLLMHSYIDLIGATLCAMCSLELLVVLARLLI